MLPISLDTCVHCCSFHVTEFAVSKKPKKKKKNARKIRNSLKRQPEPESNIMGKLFS